MAWFSRKVSLGNFPDLAGAVNTLSESVKNIEKNFDSALGFEEKSESSSEASGLWPSASDRKALFDPVMTFMGQKGEESADESPESPKDLQPPSSDEEKEVVNMDRPASSPLRHTVDDKDKDEEVIIEKDDGHPVTTDGSNTVIEKNEPDSDVVQTMPHPSGSSYENEETSDSSSPLQQKETSDMDSPVSFCFCQKLSDSEVLRGLESSGTCSPPAVKLRRENQKTGPKSVKNSKRAAEAPKGEGVLREGF